MRYPSLLALFSLLFIAPLTPAQLPPNAPATPQPTTRPATRQAAPATRPASLKEAHRIVFLVDTRAGLWPMFKSMREELRLAVEHLREDQFFTIIVLRPMPPSVFRQAPVKANEAAKEAAADFIAAMEDQRTTNPVLGIAKAVELDPDFMILLAGDDFPETEQVRRALRPFHGRLNVLLFTPLGYHPNEFLRTLAAEHGGTAMDQRGNVLEPPKPKVADARKPESRPSVLER
jgi:hypothetical protein